MQWALLEINVGDPVEGNRAAVAQQDAAVDAQLVGADPIFELQPGQ